MRRRLLLLVACAAMLSSASAALAAEPASRPAKKAKRDRAPKDSVAGGDHWRLETEHGVVHVWTPAAYAPETAGTVVYVHGYYTSVDEAWAEHDLAKQFAASRQNALFVVPEAPTGNGDEVRWPALGKLLKTVRRLTRLRLPDGALVAIGHSGGFRTLVNWLDYRRMDHVILLDAMYASEAKFKAWLETVPGHEHNKLTVVATDTLAQSERFVAHFDKAQRRDNIPTDYAEFTRNEKRARVLLLVSQWGHMQLVTSGKALPMLLRLTPLARL